MKSRFVYTALLGFILFSLEQLEYILSGFQPLRILAGDVQWYIAFVLFASVIIALFAKMSRSNSDMSPPDTWRIGLSVSFLSGLWWAVLYAVYVWLFNRDYPNTMAWRYIPINPTPEETTVLVGTVEILLDPIVQFIAKPFFCLISGSAGASAYFVVHHARQGLRNHGTTR
jgi:hypothetical protein